MRPEGEKESGRGGGERYMEEDERNSCVEGPTFLSSGVRTAQLTENRSTV